jgi:hypothetical protein
MRRLPRPLAGRHGVFTVEDALRSAWTASALANAVRTGRLVRLHRGCYIPAELWEGNGPDADRRRFAIRAVAAVLTTRPAIASHASAAVLADLPLWTIPERACITVPPRYTGDARRAHLHRATTAPEQIYLGAGLPRTTCARTIIDIAREHGIEDAVVAGDAALYRGMIDEESLLGCLRSCAGWPGIRRAERMIQLLDARAESPLESISRLRIRRAGLPKPEPQVEIYSTGGEFLGRSDFYWQEFGVVGEVDGRIKYRDAPDDTFWREKQRQEAMEDTGLVVVRWGRADLEAMPQLTARLWSAFARGARNRHADRQWVVVATQRACPPRRSLRAG